MRLVPLREISRVSLCRVFISPCDANGSLVDSRTYQQRTVERSTVVSLGVRASQDRRRLTDWPRPSPTPFLYVSTRILTSLASLNHETHISQLNHLVILDGTHESERRCKPSPHWHVSFVEPYTYRSPDAIRRRPATRQLVSVEQRSSLAT